MQRRDYPKNPAGKVGPFDDVAAQRINRLVDPQGHGEF
jgi:hypothetical protein